MTAKDTLMQFVPIIDAQLKKYWEDELNLNFGFNQKQKDLVKKMLLHASEHNLRPAKRIRAAFVYYGYMLGNTPDENIWNACMSVELVHTALLMHDDVMDQDVTRRGLPTTHKYFENGDPHYGETMAINTGDAVLEIGQELLLKSNYNNKLVIKATQKMLRGITQTAWGQAYDSTVEKIIEQCDEDDVMTVHKAKTAIYTYENPLYIGAILAGLGDDVLKVLTDYSMDGGVAFQLQDDILGVFGDPQKTGKSANSDLLQGKVTLLILKTLELGSAEQINNLKKVWGKRVASENDIENAKKAIKDSGSLDYSIKISRDLAQKAVVTAQALRKLNCNSEAVDFIAGISEYMANREL